jgi:serpin B
MTRLPLLAGVLTLLLACQAKPQSRVSSGTSAPSTSPSESPPTVASATAEPSAEESPAPMPENTETRPAESGPGDAASWNRAFTVRLHREFAGANNIALSAASVQQALAMTWAGSHGATSSQMATALQVGLPQEKAHAEFRKYTEGWKTQSGGPTLSLANRIFVQRGYPLHREFQALLQQHYAANSEAIDFEAARQAETRINAWVGQATRQEIRELLPQGSITPATRVVLVNAAYFKGTWLTKFEEKLTEPAAFSLASGESVQVPTMQAVMPAQQAVIPELDARALELDYTGDRFSMVFLLPAHAAALPKLEQSLTGETLTNLFKALHSAKVRVMLPRFSVDYGPLKLKPELSRVGMPLAFTGQADFSGMAGAPGDLWIDQVYHRARVRVDEAGTVAAAATGVVMKKRSARSDPALFHVDRPFLFMIRDKQLDAVLFMGRIGDPRS